MQTQQLGASVSYQQHQVNLALHHYRVDAGSGSGLPNYGSAYIDLEPIEIIDTEESQLFGWLQYYYQGDNKFIATLSQAPHIVQIETSYHWILQWQYEDYIAKIFDQPIYDSKLSFMGQVDPYTNKAYGKMHEKGIELQVKNNLTEKWSASLLASYSEITGTNSIDNTRASVNVSAASNIELLGNEMAYGGFANWQSYQYNRNSYYFGHGGYFSPQSLAVVGGFARYHQYNNVDWWFVDLSLSYFSYETEEIARYPLILRPERIASETNSGVGGNIAVEKHWLLGNHLELGIGAQYKVSPGNDFYRFGINLRYLFSNRQNTWPRQHALSQESLFQSYSPWLEMK